MKTPTMMKRLCLLTLAAAVLALLPACSRSGGGQPDTIRMTYNVFFPSSHAAARLAREWAAEIGRRTQGRVVIDVYAGSVLSNDSENFNCVVFGATDLGMSCFAYNRGLFPLIECLDLPHGYRDGVQATNVANAFIRHFQPKELAEVELMYVHAHGPGVLAAKKHVQRHDDVLGLRLRGTGVTALAIRAMGASAVGLSQGETYEALRKGVVEGTLCPIETLCGWRQGEVIEHVTKIPAVGYTTSMFVAMNRDRWNSLPPDIQQVFRDVNQEWIARHGQTWDDMDREGEAFVLSLGKTVETMQPDENEKVAQAMRPLLVSWAEQAEARGLPGKEAVATVARLIAEDNARRP